MKIKWILNLFLFLLFEILPAQNHQILYDFDKTPQTLMLNPGAVAGFDRYVGFPFLSNVYSQVGVSNRDINYTNIGFSIDMTKEELLEEILKYYGGGDFFSFNQEWEAFNMGIRLKNEKIFLSFGIYEKLEGYASDPEDIVNLLYPEEDIGSIDEVLPILEKQKYIGNLLGVFHFGVSVRASDKLNIGARLKFISASADYYYPFNTMGENAKSQGVLKAFFPSVKESVKQVLPGLFFADGNIGMGIDLGLTFYPTENFEISGSLLDLDYINYKNYNTIYDKELPPNTDIRLISPFNVSRSFKLNTSVKYKKFHPVYENKWKPVYRNTSYVSAVKKLLTTEFGMQTFTEFKHEQMIWAITAFTSHDFNQYISTKLTYTYDQFSPYNIGFGLSTHYKIFNLFATADNLLNLFKIDQSNYQSFQLGMNFVF